MIKVFTTNKNGNIELTKDELKKLLDEAYWEGYRAGTSATWNYSTPVTSPIWLYSTPSVFPPFVTCGTGIADSIVSNSTSSTKI